MHYVQGIDRNQVMMTTWDSMVDPESTARLIDAFVDSLNLTDYNVKVLVSEGRPSYDPKEMFKLYIYGSENGTGSSRKHAKSCRVNVEVKWMLKDVKPNFQTICTFRKEEHRQP